VYADAAQIDATNPATAGRNVIIVPLSQGRIIATEPINANVSAIYWTHFTFSLRNIIAKMVTQKGERRIKSAESASDSLVVA